VRFWNLGLRSVWFDEAQGILRAAHPDWPSVFRAPPFVEPPLYYGLLHVWLRMGRSDISVRALSALCGTAALLLAWRVFRRVLPPSAALTALALTAAAPFQILYAQQARPYMLRECLELGALLACLDGAWGWCALWAGLAGAAHALAVLWVPCLGVVALLTRRSGPRPVGRMALAALGAVAPVALLAFVRRGAIAHVNTIAPHPVSLEAFGAGCGQLFGGGAWIPPILAAPAFWLFAGLAAVGLIVSAVPRQNAGEMSYASSTRSTAVLLVGGVLLPLGLWLAHAFGAVYVPKPRYAITAQLFLLAACARGLMAVPSRHARAALLAALLLADAAALAGYFRGGFPTLDLPPCMKPFRDAAALIRSGARPKDAVASYEFETYLPLRLALGDDWTQGYLLRDPLALDEELAWLGRPVALPALSAGHGRVWLVVAPVRYSDALDVPPEVTAELRRLGRLEADTTIPGIRIQCWRMRPH